MIGPLKVVGTLGAEELGDDVLATLIELGMAVACPDPVPSPKTLVSIATEAPVVVGVVVSLVVLSPDAAEIVIAVGVAVPLEVASVVTVNVTDASAIVAVDS